MVIKIVQDGSSDISVPSNTNLTTCSITARWIVKICWATTDRTWKKENMIIWSNEGVKEKTRSMTHDKKKLNIIIIKLSQSDYSFQHLLDWANRRTGRWSTQRKGDKQQLQFPFGIAFRHQGPQISPTKHRETNLQFNPVKLIKAGPGPWLRKSFEKLAHGFVVQSIWTVENHTLKKWK